MTIEQILANREAVRIRNEKLLELDSKFRNQAYELQQQRNALAWDIEKECDLRRGLV